MRELKAGLATLSTPSRSVNPLRGRDNLHGEALRAFGKKVDWTSQMPCPLLFFPIGRWAVVQVKSWRGGVRNEFLHKLMQEGLFRKLAPSPLTSSRFRRSGP